MPEPCQSTFFDDFFLIQILIQIFDWYCFQLFHTNRLPQEPASNESMVFSKVFVGAHSSELYKKILSMYDLKTCSRTVWLTFLLLRMGSKVLQVSWTNPFLLFISSTVPIRDPRYLHFPYLMSLYLLIWYRSVLDLLIHSSSSRSISGMTLSTMLFLVLSDRMKMVSSVNLGPTITFVVSLSGRISLWSQSGRW